jgi:hypothetical protein
MQLPMTGGCRCGAVRYEIAAAPLVTYTCHCTECQRATGSAFSLAIVVPDSAFLLTKGQPKLLERTADSGRVGVQWLCPECGGWFSGAPFRGFGAEEPVRVVRAGTLDDTSWLRPTVHYWTRSKQPWVFLPEGDKIFDTQPG